MSSTGKKGKKQKAKTVPLHAFLADGSKTRSDAGSETATIVVPKTFSWADDMDDCDVYRSSLQKEAIVLPTAPRAALDIDPSTRVPKDPPFTAYIANLAYEVELEDVKAFFGHLKVKSVRIPREGDAESGRYKGFGYADFEDQASLIEALGMNDRFLLNRKIRIDLATHAGSGRDREGGGRYGDRDGRYGDRGGGGSRYRVDDGEDRTAGDWRSGPRPLDDRTRDERGGRDHGGYRDGRRNFDNYEPPRSRGGYDSHSDRHYDRRGGEGFGRRDDRHYGGGGGNRYERRSPEPMRERPKLNLVKRTLPMDAGETDSSSSSIFGGAKPVDTSKREAEVEEKLHRDQKSEPGASASIFGAAKPVNTSAREREIEERLRKTQLTKTSTSYNGGDDGRRRDRLSPRGSDRNSDVEEKHSSGGSVSSSQNAPVEEMQPKKPSASIFGSAKPVDTSARQREIEERLRKRQQQEQEERRSDDRDAYHRPPSRGYHPATDRNSGGGPPRRRDNDNERRGGGRMVPRRRDYIHSDQDVRHGGGYSNYDRRGGSYKHDDYPGSNREQHGGRAMEEYNRKGQESTTLVKMVEDAKPPNFAGSNKFSSLQEDDDDAGSDCGGVSD